MAQRFSSGDTRSEAQQTRSGLTARRAVTLMKISMSDMIFALSFALDSVEHELVGATTYHSKRVAYLSACIGRQFDLDDQEIVDIACAAALHDNALTEYINTEYQVGRDVLSNLNLFDIGPHCTFGERNISHMPFYPRVKHVVLYHHENADGTGPFGKRAADTPLFAQIVHIADIVDVTNDFGSLTPEKYRKVEEMLERTRGKMFAPDIVDAFTDALGYDTLAAMQGNAIEKLLHDAIPEKERDYSEDELHGLADIFARITDYKSPFTSRHSQGIAEKAQEMARYYRLGSSMESRLYLAGALHDIGKLVIDNDVLEKPDKLTDEEYIYMQNHAWYSYQILHDIKGLEDICRWASFHHEKLDGSGYPFGKKGYELNALERLMGCIDIYQALTEDRPYRDGLSHEKALSIMHDMAAQGKIDSRIVGDIDDRFGSAQHLVGTRDL